jgi:cell division protein FtsB
MIVNHPDEAPAAPASSSRRRPRGAQELRDRRRRYAVVGLSVALTILVVNALVGENGYLATVRVRAEQAELEAVVAQLRIENQRLQQDRERLLTDPSALEETARQSLGLIKPGETLVIVRDAVPAGPPSPSK